MDDNVWWAWCAPENAPRAWWADTSMGAPALAVTRVVSGGHVDVSVSVLTKVPGLHGCCMCCAGAR